MCDLDIAPLLSVELVADLNTRTVTVKQVPGGLGACQEAARAAGALGCGEARESRKPAKGQRGVARCLPFPNSYGASDLLTIGN